MIRALLIGVMLLSAQAAAQDPPCRICDATVVTLMELYTPGALAAVPDIETRIAARVVALNASLRDSGTGVRVVLVHREQMDFGGIGGLDLLAAMRSDAHVAALRDAVQADLVGVWDDRATSVGIGPFETPLSPDLAFHVINTGADPHVFSHEIGHNFGVPHEAGVCNTGEPAFRDIMTLCPGATFLPPLVELFTNPSITYLGVPFGSSTQDAAFTIALNAPVIAGYR